ncbi:unnamed protein product [Ambrosiozyma monospora]|uniref:Unnamed protein product n=1 Tax=Ambrosiozyma monospora TaxID=43982 RepID=A0ACB5T2R1_AMBMO|nr:unnamed protein product [Ambrosiozyma monospora]
MGLYNPSSDKPEDDKINTTSTSPTSEVPVVRVSSSDSPDIGGKPGDLTDSVKNVISSANNLASTSISTVLNTLPEVSNGIRSAISQATDLTNGIGDESSPFESFFDDDSPFFNNGLTRLFTNQAPLQRVTEEGYAAYPTPSPKLYADCVNVKNGLSVWEARTGYWHCLFPKALLPADSKAISKEDLENDVDHKKFGLWFNNYSDLLGWQAVMQQRLKEKREQEWKKFREQEKAKWAFLNGEQSRKIEGDANSGLAVSNNDDIYGANNGAVLTVGEGKDKIAVSTFSRVSSHSLENGDIEKTTVVKRKFDDGSSEERKLKEVIDSEGNSRIVSQDVDAKPPKRNWFWNGK